MADNMNSYKKLKETLKKTKSLILLDKFGSRPEKSPKSAKKNRSLNRDLLNFLYRWGTFWMEHSESSCPGGSEYVWQRGVEGVLG